MDEPTLYDRLGGDDGVARLVERFYARMDARHDAAGIRAMHPPDLASSKEKLTDFLVGWLGGPPRYVERRGHPRLRARHLPFAIGPAEVDAWLACMRDALLELEGDDEAAEQVWQAIARLAHHLRNQA